MKSKKYLSLIALAISLGSCTNDLTDEMTHITGQQDVIAVSIDDASSRTAMDGVNVVWSAEDCIGIFSGTSNSKYELIGEGGTSSGNFQSTSLVVASATKEVAYFPYTESATWNQENKTITTTLLATYSYEENTNNNAVMATLISEDNQSSISFKNAGALYAITIENIPAGYDKAVMTYLGENDKVGIAGTATITFDSNGDPTLAVADTEGAQKTVTITFTASTEVTTKTFYFPMPVKESGYANKLQFSLQGTDKEAITAPVFTKEPVRNNLYSVTLKLDKVSGGIMTEAANIAAANTELAKDAITAVNVKDATGSTAITIPAKSESAAAVEHTIDLSNATLPTSGGTVTIKVEEATTKEKATVKNLTIVVPNATDPGSFTIDAPGTTVTIQAADGTVINTIEASTAENTLIISKGVKVNTLKVKKGHVRVHGEVGNISLDSNTNEIIYIIKEEGAVISGTITGATIKVVSAAEYDLIAKFNSGGTQTITLSEDVELTQPLTLNNENANITLNLGTYSLTNKTAYDYDACGETECYVFEVKAGTLNISGNGSVNANGGADYDMAVFANGTGKVNISGGKFTNTGKENDGSDLIYVRDNAAVTISGGEFEAGNLNTDVGNQYVALNLRDADRSTASITVTGGKFHKFNPANNVSEGALTNFTTNNTLVAVSGTEGAEVYEVINLTNGYTLTSNIEIATPIVINTTGSIDFNLGTYSLTNKTAYDYDACGETECYVFEVKAGTLNISGNGSVNANGGADYDMAVFANGDGKVNISGGKFTNTGKENDGSDLIYVRDNAAVTISGGEFEAGNKSSDVGDGTVYVVLNLRGQDDTTASITVTGGKFYKFNPANPGTESTTWNESHTNGFVAEGYSSSTSDNGETYVVTGSTEN